MRNRTDDDIREWMALEWPIHDTDEIPLALGLENAFLGLGELPASSNLATDLIAVYDYEQCIQEFIDQGMDRDEAVDYFHFNTLGAYVGPLSPMYVTTMDHNSDF